MALRWTVVGSLALVMLGGGLSPAALAAEKEEVLAHADKIEELRKAADLEALTEAVAGVPDLYKAVEDKGAKGALLDALGKVLKDKDAGDARMAAVTALVGVEDPKEAYKELSRSLPSAKDEEPTELDVAIVKAAGDMAQSRAVKPLLELLEKSKSNDLSKEAAIALGGFGADKRGRVKILDELVSIGKKLRPGQSTTKNVSQEAQERWGTVGAGIVQGLNRLTGRNLASFEDWETLHKDNKKRLQDLFPDGD